MGVPYMGVGWPAMMVVYRVFFGDEKPIQLCGDACSFQNMKFQDPGSWKTTRMTHGSGISFRGSLFDCEFTWCRKSEMVRCCLKALIRRYGSYCWWKKSCTTWDVKNPVSNGIFTISTGAGFLPSTVGECHGFCFRKKPLLLGGNWWKPKWFGIVPDRIYVWYSKYIYIYIYILCIYIYIYLHEWLSFMVDIGKFASPMDPMGGTCSGSWVWILDVQAGELEDNTWDPSQSGPKKQAKTHDVLVLGTTATQKVSSPVNCWTLPAKDSQQNAPLMEHV